MEPVRPSDGHWIQQAAATARPMGLAAHRLVTSWTSDDKSAAVTISVGLPSRLAASRPPINSATNPNAPTTAQPRRASRRRPFSKPPTSMRSVKQQHFHPQARHGLGPRSRPLVASVGAGRMGGALWCEIDQAARGSLAGIGTLECCLHTPSDAHVAKGSEDRLDVREERSGETASHGARTRTHRGHSARLAPQPTSRACRAGSQSGRKKMEFVALRWVIKLGATDDALKLRMRVSSAAWSVSRLCG